MVKSLDRQQRVFLRAANDQSRDDMDNPHPGAYLYPALTRNNPWGGAVAPAATRLEAARTSLTHSRGRLPAPTSTKVPVIDRTILYRKPSASTSIAIASPVLSTLRSNIVRTLLVRLGQSVSKLRKSW